MTTVLRPDLLSVFYNLMMDEGQAWRNPATPGDVDVLNLRVSLPEEVRGVQVAAADTDFTIATGWLIQEQEQDAEVVIGPGQLFPVGFVDFPFTITHGGGTMSPRAFRARTWKVVNAVTYYSNWKYWFAGKQAIQLTNTFVDLDAVLHIEQRQVSSSDGQVFVQYIQTSGAVFSGFVADGTILSMKQVWNPDAGLGGWQTPYRFMVRNSEAIAFSDAERSFSFDLISRVATEAFSLTTYLPIAAPNQLQTPGPFPTGDVEIPLDPGTECSLVLTVYDDDKVTALWSVGTDPTHPYPFLVSPDNYGEQEVDFATGSASIGSVSVTVIDPALVAGDQDGGFLTDKLAALGLADIGGRRCRLLRYINTVLGFVVVADGPAGQPQLNADYASYSWEIRDPRETERKLRMFDLVGSGAPAPSSGVTVPPTPDDGTGFGFEWDSQA